MAASTGPCGAKPAGSSRLIFTHPGSLWIHGGTRLSGSTHLAAAILAGARYPGLRISSKRSTSQRFFGLDVFAFLLRAISLARNFAMRAISFTGTGWDSGNRIVPLSTPYDASSS